MTVAVGGRIEDKVSPTVHQGSYIETSTTEQIESCTRTAEVVQRPWELAIGGYLPSLALTVRGSTFAHFARYQLSQWDYIFLTRTSEGCNDNRWCPRPVPPVLRYAGPSWDKAIVDVIGSVMSQSKGTTCCHTSI